MAAENEAQGFVQEVGGMLSGMYRAVMEGGEIQAAVRQGFNELGNFFGQAFPQTLQADEPGAVFNPLYSDIAADRRAMEYGQDSPAAALPSPADIAAAGPAQGAVHGDAQPDRLPSPSEIAASRQPYQPEPEHGREM